MSQKPQRSIAVQEIPLDQRISFRLQKLGTLLTTQAVNLLKSANGLTPNQWRLLSFLSERDRGSVHELAKLGHVDKATMSRVAAEMIKRKLIISEASADDRRTVVLRLSEEGVRVVAMVAPLMIKRQSELIEALSAEERDLLFQILEKLEHTITQSDLGIPGDP
jgi:DNA-binding MarR family transcriptional regulator